MPPIALPQPRASRLGLLQYMPSGLRVSGQREDSHDDEQRKAGIAERSNHSTPVSNLLDQIFVRCLTKDQDVIHLLRPNRQDTGLRLRPRATRGLPLASSHDAQAASSYVLQRVCMRQATELWQSRMYVGPTMLLLAASVCSCMYMCEKTRRLNGC